MRRLLLLALLPLALSLPTRAAADDELAYQLPAPELAALVDAPVTPAVELSPDGRTMALLERADLPSIEELSQPETRLGGLRINPRTNGPSRARAMVGLRFRDLDGLERAITGLPDELRLRNARWSPDGQHLGFLLDRADRVELWVASEQDARAWRLADRAVNDAAPGSSWHWVRGGDAVVARFVPEGRGELPGAPTVPTGPVVQESTGEAAPARTYQDLLASPHDELLFDHYMASELVHVGLDGDSRTVAPAAVHTSYMPSPDGRYLLTEARHRPYSYLVPWYRFPVKVDIRALADGSLAHELADQPLQESIPIAFGSVATGPREWEWRADAPATVVWAEAQDGGDVKAEAELRDRLYMLAAPFDGEAVALVDLPLRYWELRWGTGDVAFVQEYLWQTRTRRAWRVRPDQPGAAPEKLLEVSFQDRYADPGSPMTTTNEGGHRVMLVDGGSIFMAGEGASDEGNRPFVRRLDLASGETTELFRSEAPYFEEPQAFLGEGFNTLLTRRETTTEPPNYFARDLGDGTARAVTSFPHPYPELADIQKEVLQYERADGIPLTATLYLPAGYDAQRDGPLPAFVWAYPREFKSADDAGQRDDSPWRFKRVSYWGAVPFVTRGFAVLDDAAMPVVGEGDVEPNDSFVEQLISSAQAAIDEGVRRGVVDPDRVAVGGHSYGAFMTANLLAHSDLFRAGIARSGAYNRTLTPFGFQSEERSFWQAPDLYFGMSPFMHADDIDEPILLIHGAADNNPGTFTLQSERLYGALKGHGATARLVLLPHESHGYRARESVLHMLWEQDQWLQKYVKGEGADAR